VACWISSEVLNRLNGLNIIKSERGPNNRIMFNQRSNINNVGKEEEHMNISTFEGTEDCSRTFVGFCNSQQDC